MSSNFGVIPRRTRGRPGYAAARGPGPSMMRKDLPLSTYTEAYWKIDLQNLPHFFNLRMDVHALQEIRTYATVTGEEIVAKWVPVVWEAFLDHRRHAVQLSRVEAEIIGALAANAPERAQPGNNVRPAQPPQGRYSCAQPRADGTRGEGARVRADTALGLVSRFGNEVERHDLPKNLVRWLGPDDSTLLVADFQRCFLCR